MYHRTTTQSTIGAVFFSTCLTLCTLSCFGDNADESLQFEIAPGSIDLDHSQWKLSWNSEPSCVYFVEQSNDHVEWSLMRYYLAEEAGSVEEAFTATEEQLFFRLRYTEFSRDNSSALLTGDFDGDSISNYDEINAYSQLGLDPLNADSDGDGIDDGADDFDNDGVSNAAEFDQGLLPGVPDADVAFYVDAALGDDNSNKGLTGTPGVPGVGSGPKATIAAAFSIAEGGDTILLQQGAYNATSFNLNDVSGNVTLRPNGRVTITTL